MKCLHLKKVQFCTFVLKKNMFQTLTILVQVVQYLLLRNFDTKLSTRIGYLAALWLPLMLQKIWQRICSDVNLASKTSPEKDCDTLLWSKYVKRSFVVHRAQSDHKAPENFFVVCHSEYLWVLYLPRTNFSLLTHKTIILKSSQLCNSNQK